MGMPQTLHDWTAEQVRALPDDGNRYEVFDGLLLVTPVPRPKHQLVLTALARQLMPYCDAIALTLLWSPADIELEPGTLSQPDIFVVQGSDRGLPNDWREFPRPILIIEILSPSTAYNDRVVKRGRFGRAGIEYWIVDPIARVLERWRAGDERPEILPERLEWRPVPDREPLVLDVRKVFEEARVTD